jgi:hypothetical protein
MKPTKYDLSKPSEHERLLIELAGYLAPDKEAGRKAFLEDGTDQPGRRFAIEALDDIYADRGHTPVGVFDPDKELLFAARCRNCGSTRYVRLQIGNTLDMAVCDCVLEGKERELRQEGFESVLKIGDEEIIATGFKVFELMDKLQVEASKCPR